MGRRSLFVVTFVFILASVSVALWTTYVPAAERDDVKQHPGCRYCGMNREYFAHSRMLLEYADGTQVGTCSLNCTAVDYVRDMDRELDSIKVGDFNTGELIDAEKARWVLGGDKPGVMTARAKWAFKDEHDAELFIKEHGGKLIAFEEAMKASYEDMFEDMKQTWRYRSTPRGCCKHAKSE